MAAARGVRVALASSLVGRLPDGMVAIAVVLVIRAATGSFEWAGSTAAALWMGSAAGGIVQGRWIDGHRQTPVLIACGLLHPGALALLAMAAAHRSGFLALAVAAVAGLAAPQLTPCMLGLWATLLADDEDRRAGSRSTPSWSRESSSSAQR